MHPPLCFLIPAGKPAYLLLSPSPKVSTASSLPPLSLAKMVYDVNAFEISDNPEDEAGAAPTTRSECNNAIFRLETDEWSGSAGSALCNGLPISIVESMRRSGRVVECDGLEIR